MSKIKTEALHMLAKEGNADLLRALLDAGVDVGVRDNNGNTALDAAEKFGYTKIAELIESWGKDE